MPIKKYLSSDEVFYICTIRLYRGGHIKDTPQKTECLFRFPDWVAPLLRKYADPDCVVIN